MNGKSGGGGSQLPSVPFLIRSSGKSHSQAVGESYHFLGLITTVGGPVYTTMQYYYIKSAKKPLHVSETLPLFGNATILKVSPSVKRPRFIRLLQNYLCVLTQPLLSFSLVDISLQIFLLYIHACERRINFFSNTLQQICFVSRLRTFIEENTSLQNIIF